MELPTSILEDSSSNRGVGLSVLVLETKTIGGEVAPLASVSEPISSEIEIHPSEVPTSGFESLTEELLAREVIAAGPTVEASLPWESADSRALIEESPHPNRGSRAWSNSFGYCF